ncbi:MAG: hypothetical protein WA948_10185 [Pontixanthobacter sp.]
MIDHLRKRWAGQDFDEVSEAAALGGRSRGKVAIWALDRVICVLDRFSRVQLASGRPGQESLTRTEEALTEILRALRLGDHVSAQYRAAWLVPVDAVPALIRALSPLTHLVADGDGVHAHTNPRLSPYFAARHTANPANCAGTPSCRQRASFS